MNKVYPYYEIKEKINLLVDDLDTIMLKEGWTFESKECDKTDLIYKFRILITFTYNFRICKMNL
jgi:hypothetical protein